MRTLFKRFWHSEPRPPAHPAPEGHPALVILGDGPYGGSVVLATYYGVDGYSLSRGSQPDDGPYGMDHWTTFELHLNVGGTVRKTFDGVCTAQWGSHRARRGSV